MSDMTDRIDHAALAAQMARDALSTSRSGAQGIAGILAATAQVHANLALVEQQRIANLIALTKETFAAYEACEALGTFAAAKCGEQIGLRPEIAAALGIKAADHD